MNKSEIEQILKKIATLRTKAQKIGNSGQIELYKKKIATLRIKAQKIGNSGQIELYKKKMIKVSKYFIRVINFLEKDK